MSDHVTGEELSKKAKMQNLVLYTETRDPSTYEEIAESSK